MAALPNNDIHSSIRYALILSQIFGYFPLYGISSANYEFLRFSWISFKTLYSSLPLFCAIFETICQLYKMFTAEINIGETNIFMFLLCSVFSSVLFIKVAKEWPHFMKEWHEVEVGLGNYGIKTDLKKKLNIFLTFLTLCSLVEHTSQAVYRLNESIVCTRTLSEGIRHFYVNISFQHVFDGPVDYSLWKALFFEFTNIQMTFGWTYGDTFIILLSIAFTSRMEQIGTKIEILIRSKVKTTLVWRSIREEHHKLCRLCVILDDKISYFVLLSYFGNLYFVLAQLFNTLRPMNDALEKIYFFFSFGFLILRIVCVSLYAAAINDENTKILTQLLSAPSGLYNFEIERLIYQIIHKSVSISGKNFFRITRGLILKIAGAIVTYELVLIQFNKNLLNSFQEESPVEQKMLSNSSYWLC